MEQKYSLNWQRSHYEKNQETVQTSFFMMWPCYYVPIPKFHFYLIIKRKKIHVLCEATVFVARHVNIVLI